MNSKFKQNIQKLNTQVNNKKTLKNQANNYN